MSESNATSPALSPDAHLMQLGMGMFPAQAIFVAAKLGIPDQLAAGARSTSDLAQATGTNESSLFRLLRALASMGAFTEVSDRTFANTPVTELLRSDSPQSMRDLILWMSEEPHWAIYSRMIDSVRTGKPIWEDVHGEPVFPYLFETNKPLGDIFNRAMTGFSQVTIPAITASYDFSNAATIADIAGGYGHLLAAVLKEYPSTNGVLFDLPHVLEGAPAMLESEGVADRVKMVGGNFLEEIPVSADIYMLKHIIHDWYDDTNQTILGNVRSAMPDDAKVLIIDGVIPEGNVPHPAKILDLEMLISPGGMERTAAEFEKLLSASGFRLSRIIPTPSPVSIIEAVKA